MAWEPPYPKNHPINFPFSLSDVRHGRRMNAPAGVHAAAYQVWKSTFEEVGTRRPFSTDVDFDMHREAAEAAELVYEAWETETFRNLSGKEPLGTATVIVVTTLLQFGSRTNEGLLVNAVAAPWFELIQRVRNDPAFLCKIDWRDLEELAAGAYKRSGWDSVVLTPRSGDDGRDVIATSYRGIDVRVIDQLKRYSHGHLVEASEVRELIGTLECDRNVSKAVLSTTSDFAPGVLCHPKLAQYLPYRLELRNGTALRDFLLDCIANTAAPKTKVV
jgi:restriction system protein